MHKTFTIGITGNIATGKSVIRRMLTNLGVFCIDADTVANRMLYPGGAAYQAVLDSFGTGIKSDDQNISNQKLGEIVFNDSAKLKLLESLVHPPVIQGIVKRIKVSKRPLAAIEAIKLLESDLRDYCDQIWVSHASYEHQLERLQHTRGLTESEANARIKSQPSHLEKFSQADIIINTEASFQDTWLRTCSALNDTIQSGNLSLPVNLKISKGWSAESVNQVPPMQLEYAWQELTGKDTESLYKSLGMQITHVLFNNGRIQAFMLFEEWNFTGTMKAVYPDDICKTKPVLICTALERLAQINQTEIIFLPANLSSSFENQPGSMRFEQLVIDQITYPAWRTAAQKAASDHQRKLWCKVFAQPFEMAEGSIA